MQLVTLRSRRVNRAIYKKKKGVLKLKKFIRQSTFYVEHDETIFNKSYISIFKKVSDWLKKHSAGVRETKGKKKRVSRHFSSYGAAMVYFKQANAIARTKYLKEHGA